MKWFLGAALLLLLALAFDLGLMAYAMYALLGVMLASRLLTETWIHGLSAQRETSRTVAEIGDKVAVVLRVENRSRLPVPWVLMEDLLPPRALLYNPPYLGVTGSRLKLARLAPRAKTSVLYQMQCNRRGYWQIGPLVLETGDLFGLHRRYRIATSPQFLMVLPRVLPLEGYDIASKRPIGEVRMTYRLYEDPTRIAGIRTYQPGDPLNRVHWRATARTGTLHSKILEPSTVAGATLVLDLHQATHPPHDEPYRSELAITAAASIANALYQMNQQVGLVTNGRDAADRIRQQGWAVQTRSRRAAHQDAGMSQESDRLRPVIVDTRRGPAQLMHILRTLARLELTDGLPLGDLIGETAARIPRDSTVVAILPGAAAHATISLQNLRTRGFAVAAILNMQEEYDFAQQSATLLAAGIETHHLKDQDHLVTICRRLALR